MKNTRTSGITLISLVITIIVLIILASVATYSGIEVVKSSNVTAFTTELKILQTNVDKIRSQKQSFDETEGESIQTGSAHYNELIERLKIVKDYGYSDDTASIAGYKFFTEEQLVNNLHIEGVKQSVFINLEKRKVISLEGVRYENEKVYVLEQLPNNLYNVEYKGQESSNKPTFNVGIKETVAGQSWEVNILNVQYEGNIEKWDVYYKKANTNDWRVGRQEYFSLYEIGEYKIKLVNGNIESDEVSAKVTTLASTKVKAGDYVKYIDKTDKNIVLYDKNYNTVNGKNYGIQIITPNPTTAKVEIGNGTGAAANSLAYNSAVSTTTKNSYNNAIKKLNDEAQKYLNTKYESSIRCVGSVPDNPYSENTNMYVAPSKYPHMSNYNGTLKDEDTNREIDYEQMKKLEISKAENNQTYWLASRGVWIQEPEKATIALYFIVYNVWENTGEINDRNICYITSNALINTRSYSWGIRPVSTLKPEVKVSGGKGTSEEPYILEI